MHVIFSTKERRAILRPEVRDALLHYVHGVARNVGVEIVRANAVGDHVHMLLVVKPAVAVSDVVRAIKANASRWIHETYADLGDFAWQSGFGVFSVSESAVAEVVAYIGGQEEHHRRVPFAEELRRFLDRHGVAYDPAHYLD